MGARLASSSSLRFIGWRPPPRPVKACISSLWKMESCNLSGLMRRCFYTGFVAEEKPGRGWRQGDVFRDDVDSDEEVVYEQRNRGMMVKDMFYEERKRSVQMRELRRMDTVHEMAVAVVEKEPSLLLQEGEKKEKEEMEEKGQVEKK